MRSWYSTILLAGVWYLHDAVLFVACSKVNCRLNTTKKAFPMRGWSGHKTIHSQPPHSHWGQPLCLADMLASLSSYHSSGHAIVPAVIAIDCCQCLNVKLCTHLFCQVIDAHCVQLIKPLVCHYLVTPWNPQLLCLQPCQYIYDCRGIYWALVSMYKKKQYDAI